MFPAEKRHRRVSPISSLLPQSSISGLEKVLPVSALHTHQQLANGIRRCKGQRERENVMCRSVILGGDVFSGGGEHLRALVTWLRLTELCFKEASSPARLRRQLGLV